MAVKPLFPGYVNQPACRVGGGQSSMLHMTPSGVWDSGRTSVRTARRTAPIDPRIKMSPGALTAFDRLQLYVSDSQSSLSCGI